VLGDPAGVHTVGVQRRKSARTSHATWVR
jgi:hypothetical protein